MPPGCLAAPDQIAGSQVEDRYRIVRCIGRGASAAVYEALSLEPALADHGRGRVALKLLSRRQARDPDSVARFTHEAFVASRVEHPNLVPVIDFGWFSPGRPYSVMPLTAGLSLERMIRRHAPLPRGLVIALANDLALALATLHAHGIVHRDVKPSNVLLTVAAHKRPRARLLDLGVAGVFDAGRARKLGGVDVGARGTHGTPAYLSPEQALGLPCDGRADVYSLACVTYRMLTGVDAFRGDSVAATVHAHLFDAASPPSSFNPTLSPAVDEALARALEKDRDGRTPTVERFAAELRVALR